MTGGQLMAAAERRLGPYWSMTRSQVYRELPVLAEMGYVRLGKPGPRSSQPYAITASGKLRTSQLALPEDACRQVYATDGYSQSLQNLAQTSLDSDMVFSDGYSLQLAKVTGSVTDGYTATLNVPV